MQVISKKPNHEVFSFLKRSDTFWNKYDTDEDLLNHYHKNSRSQFESVNGTLLKGERTVMGGSCEDPRVTENKTKKR